ncbi:hypothetical protein DAEQUDRAFT_747081 [Daedalea quercina L-15889]|uniref:Uncharacterized protein n=1 Tax=Daedalea quercina L-15889 TaxID=1314783 RepID=A0A165M7Y4_9APHY|nr:hypothetical protein DAEQUDRAFT_747081 [Daedalea quercina L-15889]
MVAHNEKRLLWHPRRRNRFVVGGGSQITLYEWIPQSSEIMQVTAQQDLPIMKCFAWSSDASLDDLIAVGHGSGKVDLMRLEASKHSRERVLSSGPTVVLPVRNSRACNSLAFSAVDPNFLAVGLDKVRGDHSVVVWDLHTAIPVLSVQADIPKTSVHHAASSSRSNNQSQRDITPKNGPRIFQQHAPAEMVSSVAFLPSSSSLLLAGISHRWLRLFDLRSPQDSPLSVASKVHVVVTDPFDSHRIGCFGDNVATIWDARRLAQPLLTFTEKDAGADGVRTKNGSEFMTMEFSSTRRGVLATLGKDAHHVRFWDLQQAEIVDANSPDRTRSRDSSQSSKITRSWTNPTSILPSAWTGSGASSSSPVTAPVERRSPYHLVLSDTRKTKNFTRPLSSFALVPSGKTHPLTSDVMVVNKEGDLELYAVHDTPKSTPWSSRGDLGVGLACSYRDFPGIRDLSPPREPWEIQLHSSTPGSKAQSVDRRSVKEESIARGRTGHTADSSPPPLFGRGDEDGFPALPVKPSTNLAASRPSRTRTYSPAALRNLHFEYSALARQPRRQHTDPSTTAQPTSMADTLSLNGGSAPQKDHVHHGGKVTTEKALQHLVEEDISMVMRQRVVRGYGLTSSFHNAMVVRDTSADPALVELWRWLHHSHHLLCKPTPRVEGFNFSYQGLLGIWEGFPSSHPHTSTSTHTTPRVAVRRSMLPNTPIQSLSALPLDINAKPSSRHSSRRRPHGGVSDEFLAAVTILADRNGLDTTSWKPAVTTSRLTQRHLGLHLCGWSLAEDELMHAIKRWEKEGRHSQAACWLVFMDQSKFAIELLMRSGDESLHMMSGMLAALAPASSGTTENSDLLEHCERLIVRMQDPYLRAMLTYLAVRDWSEVLQEEALPLRERLAIAFHFLDDRDLGSYLHRVAERSSHDGNIEGLIVTGLTAAALDILQSYVDVTSDVQTAATLSSLTPAGAHDTRANRWLDAYRDLFDNWKLFHHRCQFDIDRGQILQDAIQNEELARYEWAPRQILLRCHYCNKPMDSAPLEGRSHAPRATACPHCGRPLPRCSVCLMTLSIVQDSARNAALIRSGSGGAWMAYLHTIDDALVFCQTCRHGGHASHVLQWFYGEDRRRSHGTCPVAGCDCRCSDGF